MFKAIQRRPLIEIAPDLSTMSFSCKLHPLDTHLEEEPAVVRQEHQQLAIARSHTPPSIACRLCTHSLLLAKRTC